MTHFNFPSPSLVLWSEIAERKNLDCIPNWRFGVFSFEFFGKKAGKLEGTVKMSPLKYCSVSGMNRNR